MSKTATKSGQNHTAMMSGPQRKDLREGLLAAQKKLEMEVNEVNQQIAQLREIGIRKVEEHKDCVSQVRLLDKLEGRLSG
jgi:hypothetical protein